MRTQTVSHTPTAARLPLLLNLKHLVIIGCPRTGCCYTASALSEGRAIRSVAAHIVKAHLEANRGGH